MEPALRSGSGRDYGRVSLWLDQVDRATPSGIRARPALETDTEVDVVVVGGGLTGLWTAYYLAQADPGVGVLVVEAETAGFGASGRNGGWCSALFPVSAERLARRHGAPAAHALRAAMRDTVTEVGRVATAEDIRCDFRRGGILAVARNRPQLARAHEQAAAAAHWGDEVQVLTADEAQDRLAVPGALGGTWTADCARLHPGRLVRGLADVVERQGTRIAERTVVTRIAPGRVEVRTAEGSRTVRARHVVRATEAWTARLPDLRRSVAPVYSLMVATEPLPDDAWARIGLAQAETFTDHGHLVVYGQRTADGRIAFGGRGAPYHWGSSIRPAHDHSTRVFASLERTLVGLLPDVAGARITHRWGGPLGIARDWSASVGYDAATGTGWAGGYVGDGLSTTNLAGRTLADLITGRRTALTALPWVGHTSPAWEPEPLRCLGINAGLAAMTVADTEERVTGRQSLVAKVMAPLLGH